MEWVCLTDVAELTYGSPRAGDGEIYVLSNSDGMIRKMITALAPPAIQSVTWTNGMVTLVWPSISNHHYRVQYQSSLDLTNWTDLAGDVAATNSVASKTDLPGATSRFYHVFVLP